MGADAALVVAAPPRRPVRSRLVAGVLVGAGLALAGARLGRPARLGTPAALFAAPRAKQLARDARAVGAVGAVDAVSLRLAASNEYGPCVTDHYPFLYGLDTAVLVEPHKLTSLTIENPVAGAFYAWDLGSGGVAAGATAGTSIAATYASSGLHAVTVEGYVDGVAASHAFTVYAKYVRREIRALNERDRIAFLEAAKVVWSVTTEAGVATYGARYKHIDHLTVIHNDLAGNPSCDFIHGATGYAFTNAHAALGNMLEQSLQSINPEIALPYWDYSIDTWEFTDRNATTGNRLHDSRDLMYLWDSPIWTADFFGSSDPDTGVIRDGAWAHTELPVLSEAMLKAAGFTGHFMKHGFASCYGQDADVCEEIWLHDLEKGQVEGDGFIEARTGISERHMGNSFGLLRSPWNMRAEPTLVRSRKMCGARNNAQFPDCMAFIQQQKNYDTFEDYMVEVQVSPHGTVHVFTGGAFGDCSETFSALEEVIPSAYWVNAIKEKASDLQKNMWMAGVKSCPARGSCAGRTQSDCSCHCLEIEQMMRDGANATAVGKSQTWQYFLTTTMSGFDEEHAARAYLETLPDRAKLRILKAVCVDVLTGDMLGSNSPYDIAFFATHAAVERLWQRKALAGNVSDMSWPQQTPAEKLTSPLCPGQKAGYRLIWFDYALDDAALNSSSLTNVAWRDLLNPANPAYATAIPYVYDSFKWEHCLNYVTANSTLARRGIDASLMEPDQWVWKKPGGRDAGVAVEDARQPVDARVAAARLAAAGSWSSTACLTNCNCSDTSKPVMDGMDVVSYHPGNGDVSAGSADYTIVWDGYKFYFASQDNLDTFTADPASYVPKYGGFCAYGIASETSANGYSWSNTNLGPPISTTNYKVYNGSLYMFRSSSVMTDFFDSYDTMKNAADNRWDSWFSSESDALGNTICTCKNTEDDDDSQAECYSG